MKCEHSLRCPLYEKFAFESTLAIWKVNYCESDYKKCFRYKLTAMGKTVPATMLPNGKDIADKAR